MMTTYSYHGSYVPLTEGALRRTFISTSQTPAQKLNRSHLKLDEAFPYLVVNGIRFDLGLADNPYPFSDYFVADTRRFWTEDQFDGESFVTLELLLPFCSMIAKHVVGKVFVGLYYRTSIPSTWFDPVVYYENEADAVIMGSEYLRDKVFHGIGPDNALRALLTVMKLTGGVPLDG